MKKCSLIFASVYDERIVSVFIVTGGLHYVFEKLAGELYLLSKIDAKIHLLMRTIAIGFDIRVSVNSLYEANESLLRADKRYSWEFERKTKEVESLRNEFRAKAKLLK